MIMPSPALPLCDPIDAAFLRRALPSVPAAEQSASGETLPGAVAIEPVPCRVDTGNNVVERLMAAVPDQWTALADRVEQASRGHCRVVAVAGGNRGEGRTTIVEGLVATLRARRRRVAHVRGPSAETGETLFRVDGERSDIAIVDAGIWFPPGPILRRRVELLSLGCDAVILVRRAAEPSCPARGAILEQIGLHVIGEVETFAPRADLAGNCSA